MKKSVVRVFSMLLALVMLMGMTATAEINRITFDLNAMNGLKLDGILSMGFDQDGCEQYMFENSQLGKWVLQSDGMSLVAGGDQAGYYAISAADLSTAITNVISAIVSEELGEEFLAVMNYANSPAFENDLGMAMQILSYEANRVASLAQSMGLVKIHENGDLEINANLQDFYTLIANYLNSLSQDANVLNAFAGLEIFTVLGIPMAENASQLPEMLKSAASQIESNKAALTSEMDGGIKLYISAETGIANGEYYTVNMYNGQVINSTTEKFTFSEQFISMETVTTANGGVVTQKISYSLVEPFYYNNYVSAVFEDQSIEISVAMDNSGLKMTADAKTEVLSGEGYLTIDANGINGECDFTGEVTLNGNINFDPANEEFNAKINFNAGSESLKASVEYEDDELYAELIAIEDGQIIADFTVSGSSTYRIKGSWKNYSGSHVLNATLRMKNVGPELEGTYQVTSNYGASGTYDFSYAANNVDDKTEFVITMVEGSLKRSVEVNTMELGSVEKASIVYYIDNGRNVSTIEAEAAVDTIADTITANWVLKENEYSEPVKGTFYWDASLVEAKWSDGEMSYRVYAEGKKDYSDINVTAGLSGYQLSDPENVMDAILFVLNANIENGLTFEAVLNTMMNVFASAAFDGQALKVEVTANGETVSFEAKMVETDNGQYLEVSGIVQGMPVAARIGVQMENANTMCFFVEITVNGQTMKNEVHFIQTENGFEIEVTGDQVVIEGLKATLKAGAVAESEETIRFYAEAIAENGQKIGAYLPVTFVETRDKVALSGNLYVSDGSQQMDIGSLSVSYEELNENLEHVAGTPLSAADLTSIILELAEQLIY